MVQKIIKGTTLLMFASLIIGFVIYKTGYFDAPISTNSIQKKTLPKDTVPPLTPKQIEMFSSSKSMIIREPVQQQNDTDIVKKLSIPEIDPMMWSSKFATIINPEDLKKLETDTTIIDSLDKK